MHHNKASSATLIESMEDGDVRDHELLNPTESGQRALLRYEYDVKPAWKDKSVSISSPARSISTGGKNQTVKLD